MKKIESLFYSMYATGLVIKLLKLPMHTVIILASLFMLIVYYTTCLVRKNKDVWGTITGFVTVVWLFGLLSILKHFLFSNIVLLVACLISLALIFALYKKRSIITSNSVFLFITIFITVVLSFLPAHKTYYVTNIRFNYEIERDYRSWDKYSWFLYVAGKEEEALSANTNAQKAIEFSLTTQKNVYSHENEYISILKGHELAIKNRDWIKYP